MGMLLGECHFDVASGPFKWPGSALMWPRRTLKNPEEQAGK